MIRTFTERYFRTNINVSISITVFCFAVLLFSTAQKLNFSFTDFVSTCDRIFVKLRIYSHLVKKSLKENITTAWKVSKYGVFLVCVLKYRPEKTLYLDTFHGVYFAYKERDVFFKAFVNHLIFMLTKYTGNHVKYFLLPAL